MPESTQVLSMELVVDTVNEVLANKRALAEPVGPDTPLHELGLDSLEVTHLFASLEERSGLELDPDSAQLLRTVGDLTQLQVVAD